MGKVKCLKCNTVLESKYRHDFVMCDCNNETFVDGGSDYLRVGGKDLTAVAIQDPKSGDWNVSLTI